MNTFIARSHLLPARAITISGFPAKMIREEKRKRIQFCFSSVTQFLARAKVV